MGFAQARPNNFTSSSCLRIVISTDAFGMGIDCSDVQLVIHYGAPSDIETYVQQIGKAGRGGQQPYGINKKNLNK